MHMVNESWDNTKQIIDQLTEILNFLVTQKWNSITGRYDLTKYLFIKYAGVKSQAFARHFIILLSKML